MYIIHDAIIDSFLCSFAYDKNGTITKEEWEYDFDGERVHNVHIFKTKNEAKKGVKMLSADFHKSGIGKLNFVVRKVRPVEAYLLV